MSERPEFKKISDAMRKALLALGETPEQHVAEVKSLAESRTTKKGSTVKLPSLRELNQQAMKKRAMSPEDRKNEALRLEAAAAAARPELADARVLFLTNLHCTHCENRWQQMAHATVFLRLRRILPGGKLDLSSARYLPESSPEIPETAFNPSMRLPRLVEHSFQEVQSCLNCFGPAVHFLPESATESSTSLAVEISTEVVPIDPVSSTESSKSTEPLTTSDDSAGAEPSGTLVSSFTSSTVHDQASDLPVPLECISKSA